MAGTKGYINAYYARCKRPGCGHTAASHGMHSGGSQYAGGCRSCGCWGYR